MKQTAPVGDDSDLSNFVEFELIGAASDTVSHACSFIVIQINLDAKQKIP
jgi:hypothetical protein